MLPPLALPLAPANKEIDPPTATFELPLPTVMEPEISLLLPVLNETSPVLSALPVTMEIIPEAVSGKEGDLEKGEILRVSYSTLIPVLTKAIKEQNVILEKNKEEINTLKSEIEALKKLVQTLIDNQ